jgi:hypothetical protein
MDAMILDDIEIPEYVNRGLANKLPFWATDVERAEVDRLDTAHVALMAKRGATVNNGFDSNRPETAEEDAIADNLFDLIRAIKERKGAPPAEEFEDWIATDPRPEPSLEIARSFWAALSPDDPKVRLRFIKSDRSGGASEHWADSMAAIWPKVVELQAAGYEAYYVLNIAPHSDGRGWNGMVEDADITGIRALAADFDEGLPETWHIPPSIIVKSSMKDGIQKGQALWLVSDCSVEEFEGAQGQIAAHYGSDASITNPSRILRLPGSLHQKGVPQLVTFLADTVPTPRPLANLIAGLPPAAERKTKSKEPLGERHKVDPGLLMKILPYIDPACPSNDPKVSVRNVWMGLLSGIKNTDFGPEADGLDIAKRWSAGEFWKDGEPANYAGDAGVEHAYKTSDGSATFGTLVFHAKAGGWAGTPPTGWGEKITYSFKPESNNVIQDAPKPAGITLLGVDDIFAMPDPVELVSGMLVERENVAFVGVPKCGKTFLALEIAMCIAANRPVLGKRMVRRPGVVVYLSGEGHGGMKKRIAAWCKSHGVDRSVLRGKFFYHVGVPALSLDTATNLTAAKAYIEGIRAIHGEPVLIVIDTMARSLGGLDENAANSAAPTSS